MMVVAIMSSCADETAEKSQRKLTPKEAYRQRVEDRWDVKLLFEYDGVRVYRFYDGKEVYFTKGGNDVQWTTTRHIGKMVKHERHEVRNYKD